MHTKVCVYIYIIASISYFTIRNSQLLGENTHTHMHGNNNNRSIIVNTNQSTLAMTLSPDEFYYTNMP